MIEQANGRICIYPVLQLKSKILRKERHLSDEIGMNECKLALRLDGLSSWSEKNWQEQWLSTGRHASYV